MAVTAEENSSAPRTVSRPVGRAFPAMSVVYVGPLASDPAKAMPPSEDQVRAAFAEVEEPLLRRSLGELGLSGPVKVDGGRGEVTVGLLTDEHAAVDERDGRIIEALGAVEGVVDVTIHHAVLDDERVKLIVDALHQQGVPFGESNTKTRVLLISSGKGGVGKSSVTVNL